jgi:hypothetical protein
VLADHVNDLLAEINSAIRAGAMIKPLRFMILPDVLRWPCDLARTPASTDGRVAQIDGEPDGEVR